MAEPMINAALEAFEHHTARGGKMMTRALLAAVAGALLAFLYAFGPFLSGRPGSDVAIPWIDIEVPLPLGSVAFVIASTVLGIAAAFHRHWVALLNLDLFDALFDVFETVGRFEDRPNKAREIDKEKQALFSRWQLLQSKTSPFLCNIYVTGAVTIGVLLINTTTFVWLYIPHTSVYRSMFDIFDGMFFILMFAAYITAAPFAVVYGLGLKHRTDIRRLIWRHRQQSDSMATAARR